LFYRHFNTEEEEFEFIVNRINALRGTDLNDKKGVHFSISYGDFAILTRTRNEAAKIVPYLERAGIPFVLDIGGEIFNRPEVVLGFNCLGYIFHIPVNDAEVTREQLVRDYKRVFVDSMGESGRRYPEASPDLFIDTIDAIEKKALAVMEKGSLDYL
ncbi:hypothetical protein MUP77_18260, partial [Candidatus Bathyarchaeota archaeon]|nr:hypothetical protein [Candidatus Bathyarchaeota archaeon]